jgi:hypothetical protein
MRTREEKKNILQIVCYIIAPDIVGSIDPKVCEKKMLMCEMVGGELLFID